MTAQLFKWIIALIVVFLGALLAFSDEQSFTDNSILDIIKTVIGAL